ncbi:hypothetical protein CC1G_09761 [Coprinopsis cinerea okayama7|uniref:F-box domain-containing protein n=1 Tax=Coprinopsis cinerea (strain Okayama-7 / 130 / ATCC MYA-4618 / FGSC 9003) TaxID=240176 RepID=A8PE23_COPC7|nr:hypothetical protein CC1G_09761 [Coprinopsis cinerea okayama7\|eukprot:XP_001840710.2 hypothetical protein CC1G_09761 [Coprinopsis cinerea okayama7\
MAKGVSSHRLSEGWFADPDRRYCCVDCFMQDPTGPEDVDKAWPKDGVQVSRDLNPRPGILETLPDDLIIHIFTFSVGFLHRRKYYSCAPEAATLINITHTNRRFRSIAIGHAPFWAENIQPDTDCYDKVLTFLHRSLQEPIHIISCARRPVWGPLREQRMAIWHALIDQFYRCATLVVTLAPFGEVRPISELLGAAHNLETLVIDIEAHDAEIDPLMQVPFITWAAANTEFPVPPSVPNPFATLRQLSVLQSNRGPSEPKPSAMEWLVALYHLPQLEILELCDAIQVPAYHCLSYADPSTVVSEGRFHHIKDIRVNGNAYACGLLIRYLRPRPQVAVFRLAWQKFPKWPQPRNEKEMEMALVTSSVEALLHLLIPSDWDTWRISFDKATFGVRATSRGPSNYFFDMAISATHPAHRTPMDHGIYHALHSFQSNLLCRDGALSGVDTLSLASDSVDVGRFPETLKALSRLHQQMGSVANIYVDFNGTEHLIGPLLCSTPEFLDITPNNPTSDAPATIARFAAPNASLFGVLASAVLSPVKWADIHGFLVSRLKSPVEVTRISILAVRLDIEPEQETLEELARILTALCLCPAGRDLCVKVHGNPRSRVWFKFQTDGDGEFIQGPVYGW